MLSEEDEKPRRLDSIIIPYSASNLLQDFLNITTYASRPLISAHNSTQINNSQINDVNYQFQANSQPSLRIDSAFLTLFLIVDRFHDKIVYLHLSLTINSQSTMSPIPYSVYIGVAIAGACLVIEVVRIVWRTRNRSFTDQTIGSGILLGRIRENRGLGEEL